MGGGDTVEIIFSEAVEYFMCTLKSILLKYLCLIDFDFIKALSFLFSTQIDILVNSFEIPYNKPSKRLI